MRRQMEEQFNQRRYEQHEKEYRSAERLHREMDEREEAQVIKAAIEQRIEESQQKQIERLKKKIVEPLRTRNEVKAQRFHSVYEKQVKKQNESIEKFVLSEKKRLKKVERINIQRDPLAGVTGEEYYECLNQELEKRRGKYSILWAGASGESKQQQNMKLMKQIDERIEKASKRRSQNFQKMERQFTLRREYEKLKHEEIEELKTL